MSELEEFLAAYAASYETYDPAKVAVHIYTPCIFFIRDECILLDEKSKTLDFLRSGLQAYKESDCIRFKARLLSAKRIGPHFALIDVEWSPENASGIRTMHFSTSYNLVKDNLDWKVSMITRHDA